MSYRKLRIAWSVVCVLFCISWFALCIHSLNNQIKLGAWISKSTFVSSTAGSGWIEGFAVQPQWEAPRFLDSIPVAAFQPDHSPQPTWYLGKSNQMGSPAILARLPIWPLVLA